MSLRSFNPCFGLSRRGGAVAVSCLLVVFAFVFVVLCFSQLSAGPSMLPKGAQVGFAIASILQVVLAALAFTIVFASWKENAWLIHFSAWLTVVHFVFNLIVLAILLAAVTSSAPSPKAAWDALAAIILTAQLYLSIIVFSYFIYLQDHSRRAYMPEVSSRRLSAAPLSHGLDNKRLLSTSEPYANVELGAVESAATIPRTFAVPDPGAGYGGGMRTYEEAEENEKARLRREMESGGKMAVSFPVASTSERGILTPLGLEWREGDLPPYAS